MTKFVLDSKHLIRDHFKQTIFMAENCTILQSQDLDYENICLYYCRLSGELGLSAYISPNTNSR